MGSVRSTSTTTGVIDDRFEYTAGPARAHIIFHIGARPVGTHDVFGQPFQGDLDGLMNLGYMSKPYETVTGLYNYGFRDYRPQQARFTTPDPIRDGNNWFAYVNNDPVNYVDWWGLCKEDVKELVLPTYFTQNQWAEPFNQHFSNKSCAATSLLNEISSRYTTQTGLAMTQQQGIDAMQAAVNSKSIKDDNAFVATWENAANDMWGSTGQSGSFKYNSNGEHLIIARSGDGGANPNHFVNSLGNGQYRDPWQGDIGEVNSLNLQIEGLGPTRGFNFIQ